MIQLVLEKTKTKNKKRKSREHGLFWFVFLLFEKVTWWQSLKIW